MGSSRVGDNVPGPTTLARTFVKLTPTRRLLPEHEKTTFVDSAGNVVSRETITNKPVTIYYANEGDRSIVSKVVVENSDGSVTEKRTETHTEIR